MSEPDTPSADTLRRARVFWQQSRQDLKAAKGQLRLGGSLESGYLSLQAALNALSAVCYLSGHVQLPQSSTMHMLALCREADPRFAMLEEACMALEEAAEQNPFAPPRDVDEGKRAAKARYEQGSAIVQAVQTYLKDNRKRFFAP